MKLSTIYSCHMLISVYPIMLGKVSIHLALDAN